jgi:hypothetical protein
MPCGPPLGLTLLQPSPALGQKAYLDLNEVASPPRVFQNALFEEVVMEVRCCEAVQTHLVEAQRQNRRSQKR